MPTTANEKISIAMTTYNGERYLRQQMDSLLAQTLPFDELVVFDDASTDSTVEILQTYAKNDPRIKIEINKKNRGFRLNFENAIARCEGDLIALCDQDDIWLPDHLEILSNNIGDAWLIAGGSILTNATGKSLNIRLTDVKNFKMVNPVQEDIFYFLMYYQNPFQGASMMMRKEFFGKAVLPIPDAVKYHDVWFVHVALLLGKFKYVEHPVTLYRLHGNNTSGQHKQTSRLRTLAGHFIRKTLDTNRSEIASELLRRKEYFPETQKEEADNLVNDALRYYTHRDLPARLSNLYFELKHYNQIYGRKKR